MIPFHKMEGCGNDFVVFAASDLAPFEASGTALTAFIRRVCDRHFGLGADGVLAWETHLQEGALHVRMHYWNADGSRAVMCGNGARCVVRHAWEHAGRPAGAIVLTTDRGPRAARIVSQSDDVHVSIDMGQVTWEPRDIPFDAEEAACDLPVELPGGRVPVNALAVGNPHAVVFVDSRAALEAVDLHTQGRALSTHRRFPEGANASFVLIEDGMLHLRVWERGAGPTLACGTASCAALAAARRSGRLQASRTTVVLPGGRVQVHEDDAGHLWLTGPATTVASGTLHAEWLAPLLPPGR